MDKRCFSVTCPKKEIERGSSKCPSDRRGDDRRHKCCQGKWTIGRIVEVHPRSDSKVRNVTVRTPSGKHRRPVTKVLVIYPAEGYENDDAVIGGGRC